MQKDTPNLNTCKKIHQIYTHAKRYTKFKHMQKDTPNLNTCKKIHQI